jgi:hypothetical protein
VLKIAKLTVKSNVFFFLKIGHNGYEDKNFMASLKNCFYKCTIKDNPKSLLFKNIKIPSPWKMVFRSVFFLKLSFRFEINILEIWVPIMAYFEERNICKQLFVIFPRKYEIHKKLLKKHLFGYLVLGSQSVSKNAGMI